MNQRQTRLTEALLNNVTCPHCGEKNELQVKLPRSFNDTPIVFKCWVGGEVQKGCLGEITVAPQITYNVLKPDWQNLIKTPEVSAE